MKVSAFLETAFIKRQLHPLPNFETAFLIDVKYFNCSQ